MRGGRDGGEPSAGIRFPPPLIVLGLLLAGLALDDLVGLNPAMPGWLRTAGWFVFAAGLVPIAAALIQFRKAGTNPEPWTPDDAFVAVGVYRFTRNPMYLGMALCALGLALVLNSLGALLTLPVTVLLIDRLVIAREERHLATRFGKQYEEYREHVRRWL